MTGRHRPFIVLLILAALGAPAVFDRDSFPLATYPMYARSRGDAVAVATANGVTSSGEISRLSLELIGDIDDPLIVEALVRDAIRGGSADTATLCHQVAARVATEGADLDRVEIVTETHNVVDYVSGRPSLASREVHETCDVGR